MTLEVVPANEDHEDLLTAFFATSPGVKECWCMWPLRPPRSHLPDEAKNKEAMTSLLRSGVSPGLICLMENKIVGWCALGPRDQYPQYDNPGNESNHWAIPCIFIHKEANRTEVTKALIESAVEITKNNGARMLDGPPPWWSPGDAATITQATKTFIENGFIQVAPGARMPVLRREIN